VGRVASDGERRAQPTWRGQRATAGNARRQRWHVWHLRQRGFCKLQHLKEVIGSESHPLRQTHLRRAGSLAGPDNLPSYTLNAAAGRDLTG
jgi:hypothetical protein